MWLRIAVRYGVLDSLQDDLDIEYSVFDNVVVRYKIPV